MPDYAVTGPFPADGSINLSDNTKFPWDRLTHVMEAFAVPSAAGTLSFPYGQRANLVFKAHQNNTRVILSIGGAGTSLANWNSATSTNLAAFVANISNLVSTYPYDGVDIDWEFPTVGQKAQFASLMSQLYTAMHAQTISCGGCVFDTQQKQLTFFGSPGNDTCGVPWNDVVGGCGLNSWNTDYCIVGGYDMNAGAGFNGPTSDPSPYTDVCGVNAYTLCLTQTVKKLTGAIGIDRCFPKSKLIIGLPFYTLQNSTGFTSGTPAMVVLRNGTFSQFYTPQDEARYTLAGSPQYLTNKQGFCNKMNWARNNGIPGFALWEISHMYPANDANAAPIWDVIGGIDPCMLVPTVTPGPTPNTVPPGIIDPGTGSATNLWGGTWGTAVGGGSALALNYATAGYASSPYNTGFPKEVKVSGNFVNAAGSYASASTSLQPCTATTCPVNLTAQNYNRIDFWFRAPAGTYRVGMDRAATRLTGNGHYGMDFLVPDAAWHFYSFYLINMTQPSWATPTPQAYNDVIAIFFSQAAFGAVSWEIDDLELVKDTVTPTATPVPPAYLVDTFEDGNTTNNYGGAWTTYANPPGTISGVNALAPGYPFSSYGYQHAGSATGNNTAVMQGTFSTFLAASGSKNISAYNYLSFYIQLTGGANSIGITMMDGAYHTSTFPVVADGSWQLISVPFSAIAGVNYAAVQFISWSFNGTGAYTITLDDVYFENRPPTPTPTQTPSYTSSPTRTVSPTPSNTPTFTATLTNSPTPSSSPSSSPSNTPPNTLTFTPTPSTTSTITTTWSVTSTPLPGSSTYTPSFTYSPTTVSTPSYTQTLTYSCTLTRTPTLTMTPTISPTWSVSNTPAGTLTYTPTNSPIVSPTYTATPTGTPTSSITLTWTASNTPAGTLTWTPTISPTCSPTGSFTAGPTGTFTPTPPPPMIGSLNLTQGPAGGGSTVVVTGSSFVPGLSAALGGVPVTILTWNSPTQFTFTTPAHSIGLADLVVRNPDTQSATLVNAFDYKASTPTFTQTVVIATATPQVAVGPVVIDAGLPDSNPSFGGPGSFKVRFGSGVSDVTVKIYTTGMKCVGAVTVAGSLYSRWQTVPMPLSTYNGLGGGTYYYVLTGSLGEKKSPPFVGKFVILR